LQAQSVYENGRTYLRGVSFTAPLKLLPPHPLPAGGILVTQLNVSAGIMAGDRQDIDIAIGSGSHVHWTSQSFEKLHKMDEGLWAQRSCRINIARDAFLLYRPLPVIAFAASDFRSRTLVRLAGESSRFVCCDIFSGGRTASGESFQFRRYSSLLEIRRGGRLLYRDNTDLRPQNPESLRGIGMFEGNTHTAAIVLCNTGQNADSVRKRLEAAPDITAAVTMPERGLILIRALGTSAEQLENLFQTALENGV
jgi:urease accessory protein